MGNEDDDNICNGLGVETFSQTIPNDFNVGEWIAVFYGFLAWAAILGAALAMLATRRFSLILLLIFTLISTLLSEAVLNQIDIPQQRRPTESCVGGPSFPSGHSLNIMAWFVYLSLETITHHGWSIKKKIILVLMYSVAFLPQGPLRYVVRDHTWLQIGVGLAIGAVLGLIYFLIARFIIQRYLDVIFSWRIIRFLHIKNDYQKDYSRSKGKGAKALAAKKERTHKTPLWSKIPAWLLVLLHIPIPLLTIAVGVLGIIMGELKEDQTPNCDVVAPETLISTGCMTIIWGLLQLAIVIVMYLRAKKEKFLPNVNQFLWFLTSFFLFMSALWNYSSYEASTQDDQCPSSGSDRGVIYTIVWWVVEGALVVYFVLLYLLLREWTLFTSQKEIWERPSNRPSPGQQTTSRV